MANKISCFIYRVSEKSGSMALFERKILNFGYFSKSVVRFSMTLRRF